MVELVTNIATAILGGGPQAIIVILALACVFLFLERRRLLGIIKEKDEKLDKIIDDYYKGNLTLSEALNSLKLVLHEIKGKIN